MINLYTKKEVIKIKVHIPTILNKFNILLNVEFSWSSINQFGCLLIY